MQNTVVLGTGMHDQTYTDSRRPISTRMQIKNLWSVGDGMLEKSLDYNFSDKIIFPEFQTTYLLFS